MTSPRRLRVPRRVGRAALVAAALVAVAAGGACAGGPAPAEPGAEGAVTTAPQWNPDADPLEAFPKDGPVRPYSGPFARDPHVLAFRREAPDVLADSVVRLRDELGLRFTEGRGPLVVLDDSADLGAAGTADLRLLDGVRRPLLRIPAAAVASREFRAAEHLPALAALGGVLAASPERAPPEWLLRGVPPVFAGLVERRAAELAWRGAPSAADEAAAESVAAACRFAAVGRIGLGQRTTARFLAARLGGADDAAALREIGVGSPDFLDAAAATDAERAAERVTAGVRAARLRDLRAAVAAGDVARADSILSDLVGGEGGDPWVDAAIRVSASELLLVRGQTEAAMRALDDVLARPEDVVRLREALALRARAAASADPAAAHVARFVRTHASDPLAAPFLAGLAIGAQDAAESVSRDAPLRAQALARIGARGAAAAASFVAESLHDGEPSVRRAAAEALARLGGPVAAAALDAATRDSDPTVRAAALTGLAAIDRARGLARAGEMAGDPDPTVRRAAEAVAAAAFRRPASPAERPPEKTPEPASPRR